MLEPGKRDRRQLLEHTRRTIAECGTQVVKVIPRIGEEASPPYTIGLVERFAHPEIFVAGLPESVAHAFLNQLRDRISAGETLEIEKRYDDVASGFPVMFRLLLPQYATAWLGYGVLYYRWRGMGMCAVQMVWPDQQKRFPWESDFDPKLFALQPALYQA